MRLIPSTILSLLTTACTFKIVGETGELAAPPSASDSADAGSGYAGSPQGNAAGWRSAATDDGGNAGATSMPVSGGGMAGDFANAIDIGGSANGGASNGGPANGGASNGGSANGGTANGGSANGGTTNGGTANGGASNGGSANGGASNGGTVRGGVPSTGGWSGAAEGGAWNLGGASETGGSIGQAGAAGASSGWSISNGWVTAGPWQGGLSSWLGASSSTGTITMATTSRSICAKGSLAADPTWKLNAAVAFGVRQIGSAWEPWLVSGSGLTVEFSNPGGSTLRMFVANEADREYYCVEITKYTSPLTVNWSDFNTGCWDGSGKALPLGTPINAFGLYAQSLAETIEEYDYCLNGVTLDP